MKTSTTSSPAKIPISNKSSDILKPVSQSNKLEKYKIIYNKKAESEFFVDNSALAGFTGERILYMAVRELIENALDSCESFSILPSITISLTMFDQTNDLWMLTCEDNGTGITSDKLPVAVCSFLTSAKYMEKQQRGLFGVGLKMVAAFSTKDTDFPVKVWSKSIDENNEYYFELRTDIGTNKPIVLDKQILNDHNSQIKTRSGFKIQVVLRAKLVPITKNKIYDYVTQTSIVNPYSIIVFETDDGIFTFDRRTSIMPTPAQEILPHPSDMDLKTLKKALSKFSDQKVSLPKILSSSFQKLSYEKAKEIVNNAGLSKISNGVYSEHDLIKIVNICKKTKFQNPNTDHLSPIGKEILTIGMMSEYNIVSNKNNDIQNTRHLDSSPISTTISDDDDEGDNAIIAKDNENKDPIPVLKGDSSKSNFSIKVLKPVLTAYTSRTCVINNRPTIVETGLAYGGDISSFKLYRFANKIPLLYDEGSDVAREVISEVEINKMGITKKQAKEQFSANKESKRDRVIEVLPIHIFFHVCSTKIPYKTAGKESIASEGELKFYMKSSLSELYRKLSTQIRKELKLKEAENKIKLYKHYLPFIIDAITDCLGIENSKLNKSFSDLIENHVTKKPLIEEIPESAPISSSNIRINPQQSKEFIDPIEKTRKSVDPEKNKSLSKIKSISVKEKIAKLNQNKEERSSKKNIKLITNPGKIIKQSVKGEITKLPSVKAYSKKGYKENDIIDKQSTMDFYNKRVNKGKK